MVFSARRSRDFFLSRMPVDFGVYTEIKVPRFNLRSVHFAYQV
jgi:hypothetical protein